MDSARLAAARRILGACKALVTTTDCGVVYWHMQKAAAHPFAQLRRRRPHLPAILPQLYIGRLATRVLPSAKPCEVSTAVGVELCKLVRRAPLLGGHVRDAARHLRLAVQRAQRSRDLHTRAQHVSGALQSARRASALNASKTTQQGRHAIREAGQHRCVHYVATLLQDVA